MLSPFSKRVMLVLCDTMEWLIGHEPVPPDAVNAKLTELKNEVKADDDALAAAVAANKQ